MAQPEAWSKRLTAFSNQVKMGNQQPLDSYPEVSSSANHQRPYCKKSFPPTSRDLTKITSHLLECHRLMLLQRKLSEARQHYSKKGCLWKDCIRYGQILDLKELTTYNTDYIKQVHLPHCQILRCGQEYLTSTDLLHHLQHKHDLFMLEVFFCHECAE